MQIKLIKDAVSAISGAPSAEIVDILYGKKNVNEFLIAKKLNLNINQIRNILYRLLGEGLVSFVKKKDKKNGGWYTYFWTLDTGKSLANLKNTIVKEIKILEAQVNSKENNRFYYSPAADIEYSEEKALEYNFICPETGEVMELKDTTEEVSQLKSRIASLKKSLEAVDLELEDVQKKEGVVRARKIKLEEKKKAEERAEKRKKAAAERKKAAGKSKKQSAEKKAKKTKPKKLLKLKFKKPKKKASPKKAKKTKPKKPSRKRK